MTVKPNMSDEELKLWRLRAKMVYEYILEERKRCCDLVWATQDVPFLLFCIDRSYQASEIGEAWKRYNEEQPVVAPEPEVDPFEDLM